MPASSTAAAIGFGGDFSLVVGAEWDVKTTLPARAMEAAGNWLDDKIDSVQSLFYRH